MREPCPQEIVMNKSHKPALVGFIIGVALIAGGCAAPDSSSSTRTMGSSRSDVRPEAPRGPTGTPGGPTGPAGSGSR